MSTIMLKTPYGTDLYYATLKVFNDFKDVDQLSLFRDITRMEAQETDYQIGAFLDDNDMVVKHKMDEEDKRGWDYYHHMSDRYSVLNYFAGRRA